MEINDMLESGEIDDVIAFLSCYVPTLYSDINLKPKVNLRKIDKLINAGPEEYINPECIKACKDLWEKNIYVIDSIKFYNDIYLIFDKLDKQNEEIFKIKIQENSQNYYKNLGQGNYFGIKVNNCLSKTVQEIEEEFYSLISDFKMQDIQRGYLNEKAFLMNICNCEKVEGIREYEKNNPEIVFDAKKMDKTFYEYLKETGYEKLYLEDEHRVYLSNYYYNAHKNYLNNQEQKLGV